MEESENLKMNTIKIKGKYKTVKLTKRKTVMLNLLMNGYSRQEMADILKKEGYEPITPFDVTKDGISEAKCIGACITALLECDCVYFCKGWETSRGCRIEHLVAVEHNIEII